MTTIYHAMPYDTSAQGFYFSSHEEFIAKSTSHRNAFGLPVEEYEIQFIDGDNARLFSALGINQATFSLWSELFEHLDADEAIKAIYLAEYQGYDISDIADRMDDIYIFEGTVSEYAEDYLDDTGLLDQIPESLRFYFDVEAFARDLVLGGDVSVVEIEGCSYVVQAR